MCNSGWPDANLSPQNGPAGITTPSAPESRSEPVIYPRERVVADENGPIWEPPTPRTQLLWAAVDLDGTLSEGVWTPESSGREIGKPIDRNVRKLDALRRSGYKIVVHTARGWEHYEAIESWLNHHEISYDRIVCGKLLAAVYVDDRAVESEAWSWTPIAQEARQLANRDFYEDHQGGD